MAGEGIQLYLVRHGVAAERGDAWPDDAKRPLTPQGLTRMRRIAQGLGALGTRFDLILSSPLVRARQTADALVSLADGKAIVTLDALSPGGSPASVIGALAEHSRRHAIALVGHEPNMGELAARLLGLRTPPPFKKGAVCRIDVEALPPGRSARLVWFATPKMLRQIGKA